MPESLRYDAGAKLRGRGGINFEKDEFKVVFVDDGYAPDAAKHSVYNDLSSEVAGAGYVPGGMPLLGQKLDVRDGIGYLRAEPILISRTTLAASAAVLVHAKTGTLIAYLYAGLKESFEAEFSLAWSADGVFSF
jgi:hypothetical protein